MLRCAVDFQTAGRVVLLRRASLFFGNGHEPRPSTMLLLLSANHSILPDPLVRAQAAGKKTSYDEGFYDSVSIPCPQSA
jgi:hypothetical protein